MVYKQFYRVLKNTANAYISYLKSCRCCLCGLDYSPPTNNQLKHQGICPSCTDAVMRKGSHCQQCGFKLKSPNAKKCGECVIKPKLYQKLIAACDYKYPVNNSISQMKFNQQMDIIRGLSTMLAATAERHYSEQTLPALLIPIPLHPKRLFSRGYNQSELIANQLSSKLNIPTDSTQLTRIKNTPHQIGLKAVERRKNLKDAFVVSQALPEHIALIDDVVTTGTTITEACKTCLKHGAKRIDIWCLAKT